MPELTATRDMPSGMDRIAQGLSIRMPAKYATVSIQIECGSPLVRHPVTIRGVELPHSPNTTTGRDPIFWWRGPNHWLATSEGLRASELVSELTVATAGGLCAVVDTSDAMTAFQLLGSAVPALLARGTSLDLDRGVFAPGRCARTRLTGLAVLLRPLEEDGYEVLVDRSEAQFLLDWFRDCAAGLHLSHEAVLPIETVAGTVTANVAEQ
jgi:heterotetrameric sarcosine oxidase gamma subunit